MKFYDFIDVLKSTEIQIIPKGNIFEQEWMQKLCIEMLKYDKESFKLKKHIIFKKVFNQLYTDSKDTLFRNKISDMYHALADYFQNLWYIESFNYNFELKLNYLKILMERKQLHQFDKEWKDVLDQILPTKNYFHLSKLYAALSNRLKLNSVNDPNFEEMKKIQLEHLNYTLKYTQLDLEKCIYMLLDTNTLYKLTKKGIPTTQKDLENIILTNECIEVEILQKVKKIILEELIPKKETLIVELLAYIHDKIIPSDIIELVGKMINNYSVELAFENKLEEANSYLIEIEKNNWYNQNSEAILFFNISTNFFKLKQFEKANIYSEKLFSIQDIELHTSYNLFRTRRALLKIMNKDFEQFYNYYNEIYSDLKFPLHRVYLRLLFTIYLFETNDYESAIRECENIKKSHFFKEDISNEFSTTLYSLLALYHLYSKSISNAILRQDLKKMKAKFLQNDLFSSNNNLINNWIEMKIENDL